MNGSNRQDCILQCLIAGDKKRRLRERTGAGCHRMAGSRSASRTVWESTAAAGRRRLLLVVRQRRELEAVRGIGIKRYLFQGSLFCSSPAAGVDFSSLGRDFTGVLSDGGRLLGVICFLMVVLFAWARQSVIFYGIYGQRRRF